MKEICPRSRFIGIMEIVVGIFLVLLGTILLITNGTGVLIDGCLTWGLGWFWIVVGILTKTRYVEY